ncbi:GmrSD restriction endonuclease domain-containing protein [Candidatus Oscillochloris fontis]|uniref:GmrSD restriction endonuclease domain-containing protein n=1 Tax=Candidatus Oscillochloris fontis TaxID=2496868 RepID=UPI001930F417|nr:DUF262 domain-containing protein [Candidatus Oscillochloris fontis]
MSTDIQEMTAAEAGLSTQRQLDIALLEMVSRGGESVVRDLYYAIERYMGGAILSQQGRDTLRSLISRAAVERGYVYPYDPSIARWQITETGQAYVDSIRDDLARDGIAPTKVTSGEILPEGFDTTTFDLGNYPIDSLLIRSEQRTVFDVLRRMERGHFILNPDFQRDFVWDEAKQSKLIESTLMRIPLPVFYLAENDEGKVIVVDGLQRLSTLQRFLNNDLVLRGLGTDSGEPNEYRESQRLNGMRFNDLPAKLQNRIEDTQLILYLIDAKVPERARLDIFDRVNSGVPLSRQQMRNSLYVGPATRWLKEQAQSADFLQATGGSLNSSTMRDREAINRFCAFLLFGVEGYRQSSSDMDGFLARTLKMINTQPPSWIADHLTKPFQRSMRNNYQIFQRHAFRKHTDPHANRNVINIALFDIYSVLMTRYSEQFVAQHTEEFHQRFYLLLRNPDFQVAITNATNGLRQVTERFEAIKNIHADLPADIEVA